MKKYRLFIMLVLLGLSITGFGQNNSRNNGQRPGNYNNNGNRNNNSRPGGNQNRNQNDRNNRPDNNFRPGNNNHNNANDRNPGWNGNNNERYDNNAGNSGKYCVEKRKNSNQCIRYEDYNKGKLPSRPPKL